MSLVGQKFGDFEILERLGQGGMGAVYKARQISLERTVALKTLQAEFAQDPTYIARFHREARAAAGLNHPNLVQVHAAGESEGLHWFAMEYVEGESARVRLQRLGRLDPREAIAIILHVATALEYGWRKAGLIHRDLKPDNIFLSIDSEVKLGDLGLAKQTGQAQGQTLGLTQTGRAMGTPYYISPEQVQDMKGVDLRADIYSLGCTLFHLVSGRPPFEGRNPSAIMMKHVTSAAPQLRDVWPACPPVLGEIIGRTMQRDPAARPQTYDELIRELQHAYESIAPATAPAANANDREASHHALSEGATLAGIRPEDALAGPPTLPLGARVENDLAGAVIRPLSALAANPPAANPLADAPTLPLVPGRDLPRAKEPASPRVAARQENLREPALQAAPASSGDPGNDVPTQDHLHFASTETLPEPATRNPQPPVVTPIRRKRRSRGILAPFIFLALLAGAGWYAWHAPRFAPQRAIFLEEARKTLPVRYGGYVLPTSGWQTLVHESTNRRQSPMLRLPDGWMSLDRTRRLPSGYQSDAAVRAHLRLTSEISAGKLVLRRTPGNTGEPVTEYLLEVTPSDPGHAALYLRIPSQDKLGTGTRLLALYPLPRKLTPQEEFDLTLAAMGPRLLSYFNGDLLGTVNDDTCHGTELTLWGPAEFKSADWAPLGNK